MEDLLPPLLIQRRWFWISLVALGGFIGSFEIYRKIFQPADDKAAFQPERQDLPQPAVEQLTIKSAAEVQEEIAADDLVLGVVIGEQARAYPLNMLNAERKTKVLNDMLADRAIAVSWCDKCMTGTVFDRVVDGRKLTLAVSGTLWRESMMLYDLETKTEWSQWEGKAKQGPLRGVSLARLPAAITAWQEWKANYPQSTVALLPKRVAKFARGAFVDASQYCLVAGTGPLARAWGLEELVEKKAINDHWQDSPVVVFYLASSETGRCFERRLDQQTLAFRWDRNRFRDDVTDSVWNPLTGQALDGPMRGRQLRPIASFMTTQSTWERFHH